MKLEFDKASHVYTVGGRVLPSVTQVLAPLEDFERIPYSVLEAARIRGQHVHEAFALLVRDSLDWESLDLDLVPYLLGAKRFLAESGVTIIASELALADSTIGFAGTLDLACEFKGRECIIDVKATATIPRSVGPQTAAYERLYTANFGGRARRRLCLQLKPEDYRLEPLNDARDWSMFQSCLNVHNFKNRR